MSVLRFTSCVLLISKFISKLIKLFVLQYLYNKSVIYQISVTVLEFTLYDYIEILEGISVTVGCIVT